MATLVMRPSGTLGDQSNLTYETDSGPDPGGTAALTELSVVASALTESCDLGVISSVTLSATVYVTGSSGYTPDGYLTWKQTGDSDATEVTATLPTDGYTAVSTGAYATNPWTGLAWTWTDLNDLASLGATLRYNYAPALPGPVVLGVSEVYVTVEYAERVETQAVVSVSAIAGEVRGAEGVGGPVTASAIVQARGAEGVG